MSELKLDSLRIRNFRTFRDLTIDRLGRVNLIVGKNNVGKTSLLEAVNLYVRGGTGESLQQIIEARQLGDLDAYRSTTKSEYGVDLPPARHLFHGCPDYSMVGPDDEELSEAPVLRISSSPERNRTLQMWCELVGSGGNSVVDLRFQVGDSPGISSKVLGEKTISVFLSAQDLRADAEMYWDHIAVTQDEDRVLEALSLIDQVEDVGLAVPRSSNGATASGERFPIARLADQDRPEPLSNLGEGMNRTFALIVGLIRAKQGILLVDEVENGLHHSVQSDVWRMIFETARDLDVQVFATTHSQDCLRAFRRVANDYQDEEGMLIQLRRRRQSGDVVAVTADEEELSSALKTGVDPR
jgi:ABC-type multidrug transport system ATPase subunit